MGVDETKRVPSQKFIGMQVVDSKGAIVGSIRDFTMNVADRVILLVVETKAGGEIEIPLSEVSSIEDVVLLGRTGQTTSTSRAATSAYPSTIACRSCGTTLPAHAKFCAKCGTQVK